MTGSTSRSGDSLALTRRQFLALPTPLALAGAARLASPRPKRVAAIVTEYRRNSHAEVIVGRLLEGYHYYGKQHAPRVRVVSLYTDQVPEKDLSRDLAGRYHVSIAPTIRDALLMGNRRLSVDGIVLVGEHGRYPRNEKDQSLYPRYEFYKEVMNVFGETGQMAPVFTDKHLSYDWAKAKWMYDQSLALKFPLMAGSSVPLWWRRPPLEIELGTPIERAVATSYGDKDAYGFHALEALQCMVERRHGSETGIAAVRCLEGAPVWDWTDAHPWARSLLDEALLRSPESKPSSPRDNVKKPGLFVLEYFSGLRAAVYQLNGQVTSWSVAVELGGSGERLSTQFWSPEYRPFDGFSGLVFHIEEMFLTGIPSYPVERTLLTTGALAALFDSSYQGGRVVEEGARVETPHLRIAYSPQRQSLFNRGYYPPPRGERI